MVSVYYLKGFYRKTFATSCV